MSRIDSRFRGNDGPREAGLALLWSSRCGRGAGHGMPCPYGETCSCRGGEWGLGPH